MPSLDAAIECQYLGFQCHQLGAQRGNARARHSREPGIIDIGNDFQQLFDALASNRRYNPELGKVCADVYVEPRGETTDLDFAGEGYITASEH
jgi:hypothetical protein